MNNKFNKMINTIGLIVIDILIIAILNILGFISINSLSWNEGYFIIALVLSKVIVYLCFGQYKLVTSIFGLSDAVKLLFL